MPEIGAAIQATATIKVMVITAVTATMVVTETRAAADFSRLTNKAFNADIAKA